LNNFNKKNLTQTMNPPKKQKLDLLKKPRSTSEATAWCYTSTKETEFSFAWAIENFTGKMRTYKNGKYLESHTFKVQVDGVETSWKLVCYPNGCNEEVVGSVGVFLLSASQSCLNRLVNFSFAFVTNDGSRVAKYSGEEFLTQQMCVGWGLRHDTLNSSRERLLPKDCFEFFCELKISGLQRTTHGTSRPTFSLPDSKEDACSCSEMLGLLESGELADVQIVCGEKNLPCHKFVLASKSSVFRAAFVHNMKEKSTGKITVMDTYEDVIEDMLTHIYGGKIDGLEDKAEKLIVVADQYNLKQLKKHCEELLAKCLKIENCLHFLILADMHSADGLKSVATRFVVENFSEVVTQDKWTEMLQSFPEVSGVVISEFASSQSQKTNN